MNLEKLLDKIFPKKVILNCDRDPYLHRWYVFRTKWISLFIHKFVRSDEDRALHDHPFSFLVIPIWRGYFEHSDKREPCPKCLAILTGVGDLNPLRGHADCDKGAVLASVTRRVRPILGTRYRPATFRHRVELLTETMEHWAPEYECQNELPAWSLFFHFKREREWGFHPPEGFVQWQKWWRDKCS